MDQTFQKAKSNNWEDGKISMLVIDNGDSTFSSAIDSVNSLKTQSFDFSKSSYIFKESMLR